MTEAEWYDHDPPWQLLGVPIVTSPRRVRLFMAASLRAIIPTPQTQQQSGLFELLEEFADGRVTKSSLVRARSAMRGGKSVTVFGWDGIDYLFWCALNPDDFSGLRRFDGAWMWAIDTDRLLPDDVHQRDVQSGLMREVFDNPFRPVAFSPGWRTETAASLALRMYSSRTFDAMPALADALRDGGCDDGHILDHCRSPGPHFRGCWVVDLVLGLE